MGTLNQLNKVYLISEMAGIRGSIKGILDIVTINGHIETRALIAILEGVDIQIEMVQGDIARLPEESLISFDYPKEKK